jgi:hypothetical protein
VELKVERGAQAVRGLGGDVTRMYPRSLMHSCLVLTGSSQREVYLCPWIPIVKDMYISLACCSIDHRLNK